MKKNKKSGIILITTLFFMAIAFMLAVVIAKNGKETLMGGNRYADSEQAYLAAVSGLEFIKGQLYRDRAWGTYKNNQLQIQPSSTSSDNTSQTIIIKENSDNNGLIGYILLDTSRGQVSENNYDSKFEIFFKNNPTNKEYACINNIDNENNILKDTANNDESSNIQIPNSEDNQDSSEQTSQNTTEDTTKNKRDVPAKSFYAYVKGTCGKTVRYAEAIFVSNGPKSLDGGSMINGEVNINSYTTTSENNIISYEEDYNSDNPFITINNKSADKNGKITSANSLKIDGIGKNGTINDPAYLLNAKNKTIISSNGITVGNFKQSSTNSTDIKDTPSHIKYDPNPKISDKINSLSDINTVAGDTTENTSTEKSDDNKYTELKSGTYVFINDIEKPEKSYWAYTDDIITGETENQEISTTKFEKINIDDKDKYTNIKFVTKENEGKRQETRKINITGKVESKGNLSFIVVDKQNPNKKNKDNNETPNENDTSNNSGATENNTAEDTTNYKYTQSSRNTVDFSISDKGVIKTQANSGNANLFIEGEVTGSGKIYCDGNLTMNSGSTLETQANSGVAVWAKGNVDIKEAKNLTSESESLQNAIIEDGIEEAKNSGLNSEGSDININGKNTQIISTEPTETTNTSEAITFQSKKEVFDHYEGRGWRAKAIYKTVTTDYTIKINGDSISIYENNRKEPIFRSTTEQLKNDMYSYYDFWGTKHNDFETAYTKDKDEYGISLNVYLSGIGNKKVRFYDNSEYYAPNDNSTLRNHMGDMQLYIDDKPVGIVDINPLESNQAKYNSHINKIKSDKILFSTQNFRNDNKVDNKYFTNFKPSSLYDETTAKQADDKIKQKSNTMEEYVVNYYKKQIANTEVKGTIYSKEGNININGSGGEFNITGALITAKGSLNIDGVTHATLTYDPDYVPFFNDEGIFTRSLFESVF